MEAGGRFKRTGIERCNLKTVSQTNRTCGISVSLERERKREGTGRNGLFMRV